MSDFYRNEKLTVIRGNSYFNVGDVVYVSNFNFDNDFKNPGNIAVSKNENYAGGYWISLDDVRREGPDKFGFSREEKDNFVKAVMKSADDHEYCGTTRDVLESAGLPRGYNKKVTYTVVVNGSDEFNDEGYLHDILNSIKDPNLSFVSVKFNSEE